MKLKHTFCALIASALVACVSFSATASAQTVAVAGTEPLIEIESTNTELGEIAGNNSIETAEYISASSLLNKTYPYLKGNFHTNDKYTDRVDFYSFSVTQLTGSKGRIAITLYNIPSGNDYDLYLYDSTGKCIASSTKSGTNSEIVKTPAITSSTKYYVMVEGKKVSDYSASDYRLKVDEYIATKSVTASFEPRTLVTESGVWSPDGVADKTSLPSDATIVSASISATKPSSSTAYGHMLRVRIGDGNYTSVDWKSGNIDVPQLVGQRCSCEWYVGFKATLMPGSSAFNSNSMNGFKLNVEYEYDTMKNS